MDLKKFADSKNLSRILKDVHEFKNIHKLIKFKNVHEIIKYL